MTHKDSICLKCDLLYDFDCAYRADKLVAYCTIHKKRNGGSRKTCKDFKRADEAKILRREQILKEEQDIWKNS